MDNEYENMSLEEMKNGFKEERGLDKPKRPRPYVKQVIKPMDPEELAYEREELEKIKKMGRPSTYTPEIGELICMVISSKRLGMHKICEIVGVAYHNFCYWKITNADFSDMYTRAKQLQAILLDEEMFEIGDEELPEKDMAAVQRQKNRLELRKWMAERYDMRTYGQKTEVVTKQSDQPLTDAQFDQFLDTVKNNGIHKITGGSVSGTDNLNEHTVIDGDNDRSDS